MFMRKTESDMGLLPKKTKRENYRLVGASMPPQVHIYLTLYTLAKEIGKTDVIAQLLEAWTEERRKEESEDILIKELVGRIQRKWFELKKEKTSMTFDDYKIKMTQELVSKGLPDDYIVTVLNKIEQYEAVKRGRTT